MIYNFNIGSVWKDKDGRTLVVWNRSCTGWGKDYRCTSVELLIIRDRKIITQPFNILNTLAEKGLMKYEGCCEKE